MKIVSNTPGAIPLAPPTTNGQRLLSRCPACNPMHGAVAMRQRRRMKSKCDMCGGTERVPVDVAARFVGALVDVDEFATRWDGFDL